MTLVLYIILQCIIEENHLLIGKERSYVMYVCMHKYFYDILLLFMEYFYQGNLNGVRSLPS